MPTTATITTFYTFTANTKAKASEMNTNFSIFRGHIVPIEPLTITSSDITYDLGSAEHSWRGCYAESLYLDPMTSGAALILQADKALTAGAFVFKNNGTEILRVSPNGFATFGSQGFTTTVNLTIAHDNSTTAGAFNFKIGSTESAKLEVDGFNYASLQQRDYTTAAQALTNKKGTIVLFDLTDRSTLASTTFGIGSTTFRPVNGNPVRVTLLAKENSTASRIVVNVGNINITRDGSTIGKYETVSGGSVNEFHTLTFIDSNPSAGTSYTYAGNITCDTAGLVQNMRMMIEEL